MTFQEFDQFSSDLLQQVVMMRNISDTVFANRVELWFKNQEEYDAFRNGLPSGIKALEGTGG